MEDLNTSAVKTQVVIIFPYHGFKTEKQRKNLFWKMVDTCERVEATQGLLPIVVLNKDTENSGKANDFIQDPRTGENYGNTIKPKIKVHRTWSVDTCQMWLSGWGYAFDDINLSDNDRIVQLPGDIDFVQNEDDFFQHLDTFISLPDKDIVIGNFKSEDNSSAKELIDLYGTLALMANWFPDIAHGLRLKKLIKPRSEFLNIRVKTLKELTQYRKFAYEQTLNMLIRSWDPNKPTNSQKKGDWRYSIKPYDLGVLKDDSNFREYTDCLDQIERTERMLKLLWREIHTDKNKVVHEQEFIDLYDRLDRRSTSIRENSRIILRNMLGLSSSPVESIEEY